MKKGKYSIMIALMLAFLLLGISSLVLASEVNFQGRSVRLGYSVCLIERHFSEPEDADWLASVEEEFNASIEGFTSPFVAWSPALEEYLAPMVMSGDAEVDVLSTTNLATYAAASEGLLMPLDDWLDEDYWDSLPPGVFPQFHEYPVDGTYYSFQKPNEYAYAMLNNPGIIYNRDLLEREGLPDPYELYEAGEWTWDTFRDIAVRATQDFDGSGENDQWGLVERWNSNNTVFSRMFIRSWVLSNNGRGLSFDDGHASFAFDEPATVEALEFLQELYYEEEAIMPVGQSARQAFVDGRVAMMQSSPNFVSNLNDFDMEEHYSLVPIPKGPRADEHKVTVSHLMTWVIPITVDKDPGDLIEITNALFRLTEDYRRTDSWEEELALYDHDVIMGMRDAESLEVYNWLMSNVELTYGFDNFWYPGTTEYTSMMMEIMDGASISATLDKYKPSFQTYLNDVFN